MTKNITMEMEWENMELEKLATSAVVSELSKTDRLSSFINSGDKEPCWDGHIYIHEDGKKTKKHIKKVATQVKGKAVRPRQVNRTISYSISYDDLHAYMMNGGTMFFVVYLDDESGDLLQVYYTELLPIKIKKLLQVKKGTYSVKFRKFPTDKLKKTELLLNFYENAIKQASFAGKDIPTIDEFATQGVLESLSIHCTGLGSSGSHSMISQRMDGQPLTVYANIKGGSAPIPVEYFDSIHDVTMNSRADVPISIEGRCFYDGYQVVTSTNEIVLIYRNARMRNMKN